MNRDIRLVIGYFDHPKTIKLKRILGLEAVESHIRLLMFAAQYKPSGIFAEMTADDIEIAGNWTGQPGALVEQLLAVRLLEKDGETFHLHDWKDHNGYAAHAQERKEQARKASEARWHKRFPSESSAHCNAHSNADSIAECNPPSPSPSPVPLPNKKKKSTPEKISGSFSDHGYFTAWWNFSFSRVVGAKFMYQKKHAGIIRDLLKQLALEELISRACVHLALPEEKRWPRGAPTLEGLSLKINEYAGKCNPEIEERCFHLGILPDDGINLEEFTPWRKNEDRQLSQN